MRRAPNRKSKETPADGPLGTLLIPSDPRAIRSHLLEMDAASRRDLEERLGAAVVQRLLRTARRSRGGDRLGRVVVLHGIMGSNLDTRDLRGSWDRVWVHSWRLAKGRIADLELGSDGAPIPGRTEVRVQGLFPEYLPLVVELHSRWEVLPFAYDWRVNIDQSADRLAEAVRAFAQSGPVHMVAHSMGGLVARRFAQRHPELWKGIDDPSDRSRGGRLVLLGTPNRGSFAISLFLTGEEATVKKLALVDLLHGKRKLVSFLRGFAGSYQMLPPPDLALSDDRAKLHDAKNWGDWPVIQELVDRGRAFQEQMREVQDPERLLYVAGFDQDTPDRVRVEKPGRFEYRITRDGDGRVPHDLGLLAGVRTFYVRESHGDLPKNAQVLAGIHELLRQGTTDTLETEIASRVRGARAETRWLAAEDVDFVDSEFVSLAQPARRARNARRSGRSAAQARVDWTPQEAALVEAHLARGFVGSSKQAQDAVVVPGQMNAEGRAKPAKVPELRVVVVHADITRIDADLYAVGHYAGVLPQNAERQLDAVVSAANVPEDERVLVRDSRSGLLTGELGSVSLYPWRTRPVPQRDRATPRAGRRGRLVAVAGMGSPGGFGSRALRRLAQSLAARALHLPEVRTVASVLIGSGAGNLSTNDAVRALLAGAADALSDHHGAMQIRDLLLVDLDEGKAREIHKAVLALEENADLKDRLRIRSEKQVRRGPGARSARKLIEARVAQARRSLREAPDSKSDVRPPARVTWTKLGNGLCVSALTTTAVTPERPHQIDLALVDELVERMTDPDHERVEANGALLGRLVVPRDFRSTLADAPRLIVGVDRYTAGIHWEMLSVGTQAGGVLQPLGVGIALSRQLRTEYAPAPSSEPSSDRPLRVLIVGDPGDPRSGWDLPGARREALGVRNLLLELAAKHGFGLEVVALIGAPHAKRHGELAGLDPAGRLDVLDMLTRERWDLLHYCGHGDFDPERPDRVGWVFEGGLITSDELQRMDVAPRLVVGNACLSARTSDRLHRGQRSSEKKSEADLLPSLADEFFHRGVRNYIGTAWEVDDEGAVLFARTLYEGLFGEEKTIGEALLAARGALYHKQDRYDALWAAYQHYGDPDERVRLTPKLFAAKQRRKRSARASSKMMGTGMMNSRAGHQTQSR